MSFKLVDLVELVDGRAVLVDKIKIWMNGIISFSCFTKYIIVRLMLLDKNIRREFNTVYKI